MNIDDIKIKKSLMLFELEDNKRRGEMQNVLELSSKVATLEEKIAEVYLSKGEPEKAVINLISQASCLCDSKQYIKAFLIYKKALALTKFNETKGWIKNT